MRIVDSECTRLDIELTVNGKKEHLLVDPGRTLLAVLREELGLTGTKCGCNDGNCGSCTVIMNGKAVKSCCILIGQARGAEILTIEGLMKDGELHPLQKAFIDHFAIQCGFCTPGMIMTAKAILDENPDATEDEIREGLHGNICRCTGYTKIMEAVQAAQEEMKGKA